MNTQELNAKLNAKLNEIKADKRLLPEEKIYLQNLLQRIQENNNI